MNYLVQPTMGMPISTNCFCIGQCYGQCNGKDACGVNCPNACGAVACLQCSDVCGAKACGGNATPWANRSTI